MDEIALKLGPQGHLVGVLTPAAGRPQPMAVLLLNAGMVHRIGPHRLHVKIARRLAAQGYTCLRFDVSGVGDSRAPAAAAASAEQSVQDLRSVMDYLAHTHGIPRFAVFGICAGAVNAYAAAQVDERIAAMFMIDGYIYPTAKSPLVRFWRRLRWLGPVEAARRMAVLGAGALKSRLSRAAAGAPPAAQGPSREQFAAAMQQLVDRGVRITNVFTGTMFATYSYREQFADAFAGHDFLQRMDCIYEPDIDHTATPLAAQERVMQLVDEWLRRPLPAPAGKPAGEGA